METLWNLLIIALYPYYCSIEGDGSSSIYAIADIYWNIQNILFILILILTEPKTFMALSSYIDRTIRYVEDGKYALFLNFSKAFDRIIHDDSLSYIE